jgi:hypothetical protein
MEEIREGFSNGFECEDAGMGEIERMWGSWRWMEYSRSSRSPTPKEKVAFTLSSILFE